tara:strand:+ start:780 stop:1583 length:804 start_codon:yes stop_codon:yes gene_type:complete
MGTQFDAETKPELLQNGSSTLTLSDQWNIGENPNGGYLIIPALRSMQVREEHPDPLSVTAHFLRPGTGGELAQINTEILRSGRSVSTVRGSLSQNETVRLELIAAFGNLLDGTGHDYEISVPPPTIPPPEECVGRSGEQQGVDLVINNRIEMRMAPTTIDSSGIKKAEVSGWIRLLDGRDPDTLSLVLFADAFPPPIFSYVGRVGWVPTIEFTAHIRRRPAPGWIQGKFWTEDLNDGRMIETGLLWDSTGALVAQSRQLAMFLPLDA